VFDLQFGSRYAPRADVSGGDPRLDSLLSEYVGGASGLGGAAINSIVDPAAISPDLQKALDYNARLDKFSNSALNTYEGLDPYYRAAFDQYGLGANDIGSLEAINAIDPATKAGIIDAVQRNKQLANQLPPQGISDSLGGFGGALLTGLSALAGGPIGGALIGGLSGGLGDSGSLLGGVLGAGGGFLSGLNAIDSFPSSGVAATGGNGPAWVLAHNGTVPPSGFPGIPDWVNSIPSIPDFSGSDPQTSTPPFIPPFPTSGGSSGGPVGDQPPRDNTIPPFIPSFPGSSSGGGNSEIPQAPENVDFTQQGLMANNYRYTPKPIPGPPAPLNYFDYYTDPFRTL